MSSVVDSLCTESVFTRVFREYSRTLYNYLYYSCGDHSLSEDIAQEAFLKLWHNCASVSLQTARGYVFTTGRNLLYNVFEHQKVKLKFINHGHSDRTNINPEFLMEEAEMKQQLEQAISNLPEKQRVVFLLSRIDKKSYKEIAEIEGISKQAVEKRIYNALDSLRKISKRIK